ncbi:MAG: acetyl-CoA carboxylase biotin carboxyl carrier protein subunit [Nitrospirales bacterium]|nr:MAG: acetyl-CoA carboxylase biotin carboxyl carrier protein subunit [Nitrospirales bacterium]
MSDTQREEIESLIYLLNQHELTELEVEKKGMRIRVRREPAPQVSHSVSEQPATSVEVATSEPFAQPVTALDHGRFVSVTSPIVGTFYRSPSPDADPYVEEGDFVKKGQVLCIVEAMKLMNEIEAETDGQITKVLVESTTPVEYGQTLFLIDPIAV